MPAYKDSNTKVTSQLLRYVAPYRYGMIGAVRPGTLRSMAPWQPEKNKQQNKQRSISALLALREFILRTLERLRETSPEETGRNASLCFCIVRHRLAAFQVSIARTWVSFKAYANQYPSNGRVHLAMAIVQTWASWLAWRPERTFTERQRPTPRGSSSMRGKGCRHGGGPWRSWAGGITCLTLLV